MDLERLTSWAKIRTFCGGVWHNLVLGFVCYIFLQYRDTLFSVFYSTTSGFLVLDVSRDASISGEYGIERGDVLFEINDCNLRSRSFNECVKHLRKAAQLGFCEERMESDFGRKQNECCPLENSTHICFESRFEDGARYGCLRARNIIESSAQFCTTNQVRDHLATFFVILCKISVIFRDAITA